MERHQTANIDLCAMSFMGSLLKRESLLDNNWCIRDEKMLTSPKIADNQLRAHVLSTIGQSIGWLNPQALELSLCLKREQK